MSIEFYNGEKLRNTKDINGKDPVMYMVTSNMGDGKSTDFANFFLREFFRRRKTVMLIYRHDYELQGCADGFFSDALGLWYDDYAMYDYAEMGGKIRSLYIISKDEALDKKDNEIKELGSFFGYAVSLNTQPYFFKRTTALYSKISFMFFDEYQTEYNGYIKDEVTRLQLLHSRVARGQGQHTRYVPIYMCSNGISLLNPYWGQLDIAKRIKPNTKILKGDGWVLQLNYNPEAATELQKGGLGRIFNDQNFTDYASGQKMLYDDSCFIEKIDGVGRYLYTLKWHNKYFALKSYDQAGLCYCGSKPDMTFPRKLCIDVHDHDYNFMMIKRNDDIIKLFRTYFEKGLFRFENQECKECVLSFLSIKWE